MRQGGGTTCVDDVNSYRLNICTDVAPSVPHMVLYSPRTDRTLGDVGGQKTLRSYWRNYFEKTDALIWVVDATDRLRVDDCRKELASLLVEEVIVITFQRDCWHH